MQKNDITRCMISEANDAADLNEDKSIDMEQGVKMVGESSRSLLFCKKMKASITPPFNCVQVRVRDHELHSQLQVTCASTIKRIGRSGVYNTFGHQIIQAFTNA